MAQQARILVKIDRYPSGDVWRRYEIATVIGDLVVSDSRRTYASFEIAREAVERSGLVLIDEEKL